MLLHCSSSAYILHGAHAAAAMYHVLIHMIIGSAPGKVQCDDVMCNTVNSFMLSSVIRNCSNCDFSLHGIQYESM